MTKKLLLTLILSFVVIMALPLAFADEDDDEVQTAYDLAIEEAEADGEEQGLLDGKIEGRKDYLAGNDSNYSKSLPTKSEVSYMYGLDRLDSTYRVHFLTTYMEAWQKGYETGFRRKDYDEKVAGYINGYEHGQSLGVGAGTVQALVDLEDGFNNNWSLAYSKYKAKRTLSSRFMLFRESDDYEDDFTYGFIDGFRQSYIDTFQSENVRLEMYNINSKKISMLEDTFYYDYEVSNVTNGAIETSARSPLNLYFPKGTIYRPTTFNIGLYQNSFNWKNVAFEPVTQKFGIAVSNVAASTTTFMPITLSFEYYGSELAGIYKYSDTESRWLYQLTYFDEDMIHTDIPAGYYEGGDYAVFIDNNFDEYSDIRFSWAYDEIYTMLRRYILEESDYFYPETYISKRQLANYLYEAYRFAYPLPSGTENPLYAGTEEFGLDIPIIEYVVRKGYMPLDENGLFYPDNPVTYYELEAIFSSIYNTTISWDTISNEMLYEKYKRSGSADGKWNYVTKAEAVYMIYQFVE